MNLINKRYRILFVIPTLKKGGAERLLLNIVNELQKRSDFECLVVTMYEGTDYPELTKTLNIVNCTSQVKLSVLKKNSAIYNDFFEIAHKFKPHIIHSHLFEAEILSRWKILKNTIYFTHIHFNENQLSNFSLTTLLKKRKATDFYEKQFILKKYKLCKNNFIAISKHTERYLKITLPYSFEKQIHYLPNAIDYNAFYFNRFENDFNPEYKFLSIGRLVEIKNQVFLIGVIEELHKRNINATLDILGDGPMKQNIQEDINKKGLSTFIKIHGIVNNVQDFLKTASLYLHSATYEPFGLVLLEAMAAGLPVVALNGGGNKELITNGKNGYILNENNPKLFADKIEKIINDTFLYKRMSVKANDFAKEFDIRNYIKRLVALYYDAIENNYISIKKNEDDF